MIIYIALFIYLYYLYVRLFHCVYFIVFFIYLYIYLHFFTLDDKLPTLFRGILVNVLIIQVINLRVFCFPSKLHKPIKTLHEENKTRKVKG